MDHPPGESPHFNPSVRLLKRFFLICCLKVFSWSIAQQRSPFPSFYHWSFFLFFYDWIYNIYKKNCVCALKALQISVGVHSIPIGKGHIAALASVKLLHVYGFSLLMFLIQYILSVNWYLPVILYSKNIHLIYLWPMYLISMVCIRLFMLLHS